MLLADIGQDFLIAEVLVIEVGDFAVEAVDVIKVEFAWSQGLTSLGRGSAADSTNAGEVDMQIVGSGRIFITNLQSRRARDVRADSCLPAAGCNRYAHSRESPV